MNLGFFLTLLVATAFAQKERDDQAARGPGGHLQYNDPYGYRVSWKLYPLQQQQPQAAFEAAEPQATQRAEARAPYYDETYGEAEEPIKRPSVPLPRREDPEPAKKPLARYVPEPQPRLEYRPHSMLPSHIRQLISQMHEEQGPYVDPTAYVYQFQDQQGAPQESEGQQQPQQRQQEGDYYDPYQQYQSKYLGAPSGKASKAGSNLRHKEHARYQEERQQHQQQQQQQQQQEDPGMPDGLQRLLYLQAQTPYHIIADKILYKPKSIFVPKPLAEEEQQGSYSKYRSKVYILKDQRDQQQQDGQERQDEE